MPTQQVKGGNTDSIYKDGTRDKSEMLARVHPDVSEVTWRFNRIHHHVDYKAFAKNNMNGLMKGRKLNLPDKKYFEKLSHLDARKILRDQNLEWKKINSKKY